MDIYTTFSVRNRIKYEVFKFSLRLTSHTLDMVYAMEKELKELGPKPENQDESPKEKKLNLVGKILEV